MQCNFKGYTLQESMLLKNVNKINRVNHFFFFFLEIKNACG